MTLNLADSHQKTTLEQTVNTESVKEDLKDCFGTFLRVGVGYLWACPTAMRLEHEAPRASTLPLERNLARTIGYGTGIVISTLHASVIIAGARDMPEAVGLVAATNALSLAYEIYTHRKQENTTNAPE